MKNSYQSTIQTILQKAWYDGITSLKNKEEEMVRRIQSLKDCIDFQQSNKEMQRSLTELGKRMHVHSESLGNNIRAVILKVINPLVEEMNRLKNQAEYLSHRIEAQLQRRMEEETKLESEKNEGEG